MIEQLLIEKESIEIEIKINLEREKENNAISILTKKQNEAQTIHERADSLYKKFKVISNSANEYLAHLKKKFDDLPEKIEFQQWMYTLDLEANSFPDVPGGLTAKDLKETAEKLKKELITALEKILKNTQSGLTQFQKKHLPPLEDEFNAMQKLTIEINAINCDGLKKAAQFKSEISAILTHSELYKDNNKLSQISKYYQDFYVMVNAAIGNLENELAKRNKIDGDDGASVGPVADAGTATSIAGEKPTPGQTPPSGKNPTSGQNSPSGQTPPSGPKPPSDFPPTLYLYVDHSSNDAEKAERKKMLAREEESRKQQEYFRLAQEFLYAKFLQKKAKEAQLEKERIEKARLEAEKARQLAELKAIEERVQIAEKLKQEKLLREEQLRQERLQQQNRPVYQYNYNYI